MILWDAAPRVVLTCGACRSSSARSQFLLCSSLLRPHNAAAASRLLLSAPTSGQANAAFSLTVTVVDAYGNVVTGYRGTLSFRSSDATATLPRNYTFTAADQGVHTFTGLRLKKKGRQTITATDTRDSSLTASVLIDVL